MSTHNILFSIRNKEITINYPKFAAMGLFLGTQKHVRNSRSKRAISVRATEVLLYSYKQIQRATVLDKLKLCRNVLSYWSFIWSLF